MKLRIDVDATDGAARTGSIATARGVLPTPLFMPVGTRAAVKTLDTADLESLGIPLVLGNTYHLMLRPGADVVAAMGGLHRFMDWSGHLLTDSGGYQIFSLEPKVTDDGATFRSTYDGSTHHLTPEGAVEVQTLLGADIQMVLDVCPALPSSPAVVQAGREHPTVVHHQHVTGIEQVGQVRHGAVGHRARPRHQQAGRVPGLGRVLGDGLLGQVVVEVGRVHAGRQRRGPVAPTTPPQPRGPVAPTTPPQPGARRSHHTATTRGPVAPTTPPQPGAPSLRSLRRSPGARQAGGAAAAVRSASASSAAPASTRAPIATAASSMSNSPEWRSTTGAPGPRTPSRR